MSIDIRNRVTCTAFSCVTSEKDIRAAMAFSTEHGFRGFLIDSCSYIAMQDDVHNYKKLSLAVNFPYAGLSKDTTLQSLASLTEAPKVTEFFISLDKFDISRGDISSIREYIKHINTVCPQNINFAVEYSWIRSAELLDKICSILEPYERHSLVISTYCQKPDKLQEVLSIGKHLGSNGSCKYSYFGAIPSKKESIIELLSSGFAYCGVPKQYIGLAL